MKDNEIIKSLEKIYSVSEDPHSIYTPLDLCDEMISSITKLEGNILVISNLEFLITLKRKGIDMNTVHYTVSCEYKKSVAVQLGLDLNNIYELNYNSKEIDLGIKDMKFDVIIANPPYNRGLHLKFLNKTLDYLNYNGELIFIHPSEWLVQKKQTSTTKKYNILKNTLDKNTIDIRFINNPWKNGGALLFVPLVITKITNNKISKISFTDERTEGYGKIILKPKDTISLNTLNEITIFGDVKLTNKTISKVFTYCKNFNWKDKTLIYNGDFYVNLSRLSGNGYTDILYTDGVKRKISNMYSLINSTSLNITNKPQRARAQGKNTIGNEKIWISFNTEYEAINCLNFLKKCKFFKFYLSILKIDQNAANNLLEFLPWLDWTQEWTDDKIIKFFDLTEEEVANIDEVINIITIK